MRWAGSGCAVLRGDVGAVSRRRRKEFKKFCDFAQEVPRVFGFGNALGAAILRLLTPWAVSGELGGMSITENVKSKYFNGLLRICVHWRR